LGNYICYLINWVCIIYTWDKDMNGEYMYIDIREPGNWVIYLYKITLSAETAKNGRSGIKPYKNDTRFSEWILICSDSIKININSSHSE
jgi:hypothetical protein